LDESEGDLRFLSGVRVGLAFEQFGGEILSGDDHAPEGRESDHGQQRSSGGSQAKLWVEQQRAEAAEFVSTGLFGFFPALRFVDSQSDPDAQQSGDDSQQIGGSPAAAGGDAGRGGEPESTDAGRMKNAPCARSGPRGEDVCHQRRADGPFPADAHRHQKPQDAYLPDVCGKCRQAGEYGIEQNCEHHHGATSPAIGQRTEQPASECAAEQEGGHESIAGGPHPRILGRFPKEFREHFGTRDVVELAFEGIEDPAE
jgi:hypothetical protein